MMKAKAVVFTAADKYEIQTLTLAEPGPTDVTVRTVITAVSPGTERWVMRGKHIGTDFPCIPGYHRIGVVEAVGSDVTRLKPGDWVYGSSNRWQEPVKSMFGAHISASVGPEGGYDLLSHEPMPFDLAEQIAFSILVGVGNRGVNAADVKPGQRLLHIGAGIVTLAAAQIAQHRGTESLIIDNNPERVAFIRERYPEFTVVNNAEPGYEEKLKAFAPNGFDVLQDTVGLPAVTDKMIPFMRAQGTLLFQAQYFDKERCAVDLDQIKIKELTVKTTCGVRANDLAEVRNLIRKGWLKVTPCITHRFTADNMLDAYVLLDKGTPHNLGMVIKWD
ncbi:MAG: zinc-binding dehydrogenase [Lentisphaerae bacterium]|jgi:2-desacetyl-2-hydroxyethyl bacteriochlorophyllide A dehydrogenase|nr:zinc-binding dehydrogenase [Lentisphaerota bacterium]